jgi:hypothetical protein
MRVLDGRGAAGKDDLAGARVASHAHNLAARVAADNAVVDEAHDAALELGFHGAQLAAHALLTRLLSGQDECPVDVAVLDEAVGERLSELLRDDGGGGIARFGDGDNDVYFADALLAEHLADLVGQPGAHVLAAGVDRDAVHDSVGPREVDVLKNIGSITLGWDYLVELRCAALLDEDGLTGKDVPEVAEAQLAEGDALRGEHVVNAALDGGRRAAAHDEGTDTVRITEGQDTKTGQHSSYSPTSLAALVGLGQGAEDVINVDASLASLVQSASKHIEHKLAVRVGVDMAVGLPIQVIAQIRGIDQVAVVGEADAVGGVDIERLAFGALRQEFNWSAIWIAYPVFPYSRPRI